MKALAAAIALTLCSSAAAFAETHKDWETVIEDGRCWAFTKPTVTNGEIEERKNGQVTILNQPKEDTRGAILIEAGHDANLWDVDVVVDGKRFDFLPFESTAFIQSGKPEGRVISAMRRGESMTVTWRTPNAGMITETFSLMGFSAAKAEIDRKCR
ncbi:hypothetical protein [Roseibium sp. RKSG952]|uniref:hypothetical protein n=1 Tax=Roseibium sp. RKSG952 TaxID=2529384 RepID=UPI0012BCCBD6|nr:hypothetical protein [Roseibium sp. RKSG952]MTH95477.1 hypothetical protein [Roseibium sp. RKSG952]